MQEHLCTIEFYRDSSRFVARIQTELGGRREYNSESFDDVLNQAIVELQEEFEGEF